MLALWVHLHAAYPNGLSELSDADLSTLISEQAKVVEASWGIAAQVIR